jgi:hypothetical protein
VVEGERGELPAMPPRLSDLFSLLVLVYVIARHALVLARCGGACPGFDEFGEQMSEVN